VTRAIALGNLLLALLAQDDVAAAREAAAEFVELTRSLAFMYLGVTCDALALLAAQERRWAAAAQLLGFADTTYLQDQQQREPNEARARERCAALLDGQCEPAGLEAWRADGAGLTPETVCALALARAQADTATAK